MAGHPAQVPEAEGSTISGVQDPEVVSASTGALLVGIGV